MIRSSVFVAVALTSLIAITLPSNNCLASASEHGWNDDGIAWIDDWEEAKAVAKRDGKPLMLVIHRTWCGACKSLRPKFDASKEIEALSGQLVMVNSADESKFTETEFSPDGGYVPRILFFDPEGNHLEEIVQRSDKYKYFHYDPSSIVTAMKEAVEQAGSVKPEQEENVKSEL